MNVWTSAVNVAVRLAEETADDTKFDVNTVSPGAEGFIMTAVLALAVIGLGFVLVRRMRANAYRHDVREEIEAELAEAELAAAELGADELGADDLGAEAAGAAPDRGDATGDEADRGVADADADADADAEGAAAADGTAGNSAQK